MGAAFIRLYSIAYTAQMTCSRKQWTDTLCRLCSKLGAKWLSPMLAKKWVFYENIAQPSLNEYMLHVGIRHIQCAYTSQTIEIGVGCSILALEFDETLSQTSVGGSRSNDERPVDNLFLVTVRAPSPFRDSTVLVGNCIACNRARQLYKNISMLFCFRWKTVSLVQASLQYLMHHVTVSLQQSKITLQNNCINNTSITQPTLSFYFWLMIMIRTVLLITGSLQNIE